MFEWLHIKVNILGEGGARCSGYLWRFGHSSWLFFGVCMQASKEVGCRQAAWPMHMGTGWWQGRAAADLATPGLRCYCHFLNGLLPFGFTELRCNPGQFACRSGTIQCIPLPWQCDGWVTCEDESDEANCPGECWAGRCM